MLFLHTMLMPLLFASPTIHSQTQKTLNECHGITSSLNQYIQGMKEQASHQQQSASMPSEHYFNKTQHHWIKRKLSLVNTLQNSLYISLKGEGALHLSDEESALFLSVQMKLLSLDTVPTRMDSFDMVLDQLNALENIFRAHINS